MKILIIEKDETVSAELGKMLSEYNPGSILLTSAVNKAALRQFLFDQPHIDLIFLDFTLGEEFVIELINELSIECPIVFLTNQIPVLLKFHLLFYIDFLIKPITALDLGKALLKYERFKWVMLSNSNANYLSDSSSKHLRYKKRFLIRLGSRMLFVDADDIAYFSVTDKNVYLVNNEGVKYPLDYSLEKLQQLLDPIKFFRVNRKVICSTKSIKEIKTYINSRLKLILTAGNNTDETLVSREKVAAFKEWVEG